MLQGFLSSSAHIEKDQPYTVMQCRSSSVHNEDDLVPERGGDSAKENEVKIAADNDENIVQTSYNVNNSLCTCWDTAIGGKFFDRQERRELWNNSNIRD